MKEFCSIMTFGCFMLTSLGYPPMLIPLIFYFSLEEILVRTVGLLYFQFSFQIGRQRI